MRPLTKPLLAVVALCSAVASLPAAQAIAAEPGAQLVANSANVQSPHVTPDGRYVVFTAYGSGLVPQPAQGWQVYLYDRTTRKTELISVSPAGAPAPDRSVDPSISDDGCKVAFASDATNLVSGDANKATDIFVRERCGTPRTVLASVDGSGKQLPYASTSPSISGNGSAVAFQNADSTGTTGIQLYDTATGTSRRIVTDGRVPSISADGTRVAFWSYASTLVPGDTNGAWDMFLWANGTIGLVSADANGVQQVIPGGVSSLSEPVISADGSHVAFPSNAANLVAGDTNGVQDVFVKDVSNVGQLPAGPIVRASVSSSGVQGDRDSGGSGGGQRPSLSRDGRFVLFTTDATTLAPETKGLPSSLVLRDVTAGTTLGLYAGSIGPRPTLSPDPVGRYVAFLSSVARDPSSRGTGVFVLDRQAGGGGGGGGSSPPPPPVRGVSVDGAVVKGTVLVNGKPLTAAARVPVGARIDATKGTFRLTSVNGTMNLYSGAFTIREPKGAGPTQLVLRGGSFAKCPKPGKRKVSARGRPPIRSLWGNGKGRFQTRGHYASATVRGTIWLTQDRCDGTYIRVKRGVVAVLDLVRHKTTVVRAGHSILVKRK
jgi:Tol biopolymer transport system component